MFNFQTGVRVLWQIETDAENDGWQESRTKTNGGAGRTSLTALLCLLLCCLLPPQCNVFQTTARIPKTFPVLECYEKRKNP